MVFALWGFSSTDFWAGGEHGQLLHWNGAHWLDVPSGTSLTIHAIWGSAPNDVWAVGGDPSTVSAAGAFILHWDGAKWANTWADATTGGLLAVWGTAANDVWAVGVDSVLHWDGKSWSTPRFFSGGMRASGVRYVGVWASSADDVWIVSENGPIHWDGTSWLAPTIDTPLKGYLQAIWGSDRNHVWAVGGEILRCTPNGCSHEQGPPGWTSGNGGLAGVWGTSATDVWAVGMGCVPDPAPYPLPCNSGRPALLHYDGKAWSLSLAPPQQQAGQLLVIRGSSATDVWAVGVGMMHFNGTNWTSLMTLDPLFGGARTLWASGPDDVWVSDNGFGFHLSHWNGKVRESVKLPVAAPTRSWIAGIWGSGPNDVWAVGTGALILHWDGVAWSVVPVPASNSADFNAVWGSSANDVWAVGGTNGPVIAHWDGVSWKEARPPLSARGLSAVWGSSAKDVWAVGRSGLILHWNGNAWAEVGSSSGNALNGVWGSSAADVWVVGDNGTILHGDGRSWTDMTAQWTNEPLLAVWGSGARDVWAAGGVEANGSGNGTLLRWDGKAWSPVALPPLGYPVTSISGVSPTQVWAATGQGILRFRP